MPDRPAVDADAVIDAVLRDIAADDDAAYRPPAALYQDFAIRCRMRGLPTTSMAADAFGRSLALARAGLFPSDLADELWQEALRIAASVPEDTVGVFMLIARAARYQLPCPSEAEIARVYGTHSIGRVRRLLSYMETRNHLALRVDLRGRRTAAIPGLGWATAPEEEQSSRGLAAAR